MTSDLSLGAEVSSGIVVKAPPPVSAEARLLVRFDIWEQGNVSPLQLGDKLQGALRHALCDTLMELRVLPNPLCVARTPPATKAPGDGAKGERFQRRCRVVYVNAPSKVWTRSPL